MRAAIIGRTKQLLLAAELWIERGHSIPVVWTCRSEPHYGVDSAQFADMANAIGAQFFDDARINDPRTRERIEALNCDLALSVNWLTKIQQPFIDEFPLGILNAHAGELPRYRGNACPNWAILQGEPHVGLCIHQMVPEIDAGPVILRDKFPLGPNTYIGDVIGWIESRVPEMLVCAAEGLDSGTLVPEPQSTDPTDVLRTYPRRPEDSRLNWSRPVEEVFRMVRASSRPYSGAFSALEGERKVIIWRAEPVHNREAFLAIPGQVCYLMDDDPVIACGDGMLHLTELDIEGIADQRAAKQLIAKSLRNRLI